jgi:2-hydroxycyclohexanecarboxyl-CoA dehydrogenase
MGATISLQGKVALVTGGGRGIGKAITRRFAEAGASVVIASRKLENLQATAAELADLPGRVVPIRCHVGRNEELAKLVRTAEDQLGPIDVLVNNAGGGTRAPSFFVHTDEDEWTDGLRLNLWSVLAVTHAVLPAMQERGTGAIVNIASEAGRVGSQLSVTYSAAKAGVIGFTKAIAREGAHYGVRANAVAPGPIQTPLLEHMVETGDLGTRLRQGMIDSTLMRRPGTPEEVAATITFLACDDASFITGQTIGVSGGLSLS